MAVVAVALTLEVDEVPEEGIDLRRRVNVPLLLERLSREASLLLITLLLAVLLWAKSMELTFLRSVEDPVERTDSLEIEGVKTLEMVSDFP